VLGICGGYQMMGREVVDDKGIEGPPGRERGLGLLDVTTELTERKTLTRFEGIEPGSGARIVGYEMHMGRTHGPDCARPMLRNGVRPDGALSADGRIMGCYVHGLFAEDTFRSAFLARLKPGARSSIAYGAHVEAALDAVAHAIETHLDVDGLMAAAA